jgi:hypothetical protein
LPIAAGSNASAGYRAAEAITPVATAALGLLAKVLFDREKADTLLANATNDALYGSGDDHALFQKCDNAVGTFNASWSDTASLATQLFDQMRQGSGSGSG